MFQMGNGGGSSGFVVRRWYKSGCVSVINVESWKYSFGKSVGKVWRIQFVV